MGLTGFAKKCWAAGAVLVVMLPAIAATPRVTLAWDPSAGSGIAAYKVYEGGESGRYTNVVNTTTTSATISNLLVGATYYFAVSAVDVAGLESTLSGELSYTIPVPPFRIGMSLAQNRYPVLSGTGVVGFAYELQVSPDLTNWVFRTNLTTDSNGFFDFLETSQAGPVRFYRVRQTQVGPP